MFFFCFRANMAQYTQNQVLSTQKQHKLISSTILSYNNTTNYRIEDESNNNNDGIRDNLGGQDGTFISIAMLPFQLQ